MVLLRWLIGPSSETANESVWQGRLLSPGTREAVSRSLSLSSQISRSVSTFEAALPCMDTAWNDLDAGYAQRDMASATTLSLPGM